MQHTRHSVLRATAYVGLGVAVLTGLELGLRIAADVAGVWGIVAASVLFPATVAAAPLLALVWGQWVPAVVVYGGGFAAGALMARSGQDMPPPPSPATS